MNHVPQSRMLFIAAAAIVTTAIPVFANSQVPPVDAPEVAANYGHLPLRFEANQGQADQRVKFLARGSGFSLFLTPNEAVLSLKKPGTGSIFTDLLRMSLSTPSEIKRHIQPEGLNRLSGVVNYMVGNDPSRWHTDVPNFEKVRYADVYPGINLVYYGNGQQLEYDFEVAPGANPDSIQLHFDGAEGLQLDPSGNLRIIAANGQVAFHSPVLYQLIDGKRSPVHGAFKLLPDNSVGFSHGAYDHTKPLTIDPTLVYSTYLGGSNSDTISAIAVDSAGNAYLTGRTSSTDFPVTPGAFQTTDKDAASTVFVTKLNSSGSALIYSTLLGGTGGPSGGDIANSIAIDASGDAYVAGYTYSSNFPTTKGAFQTANKAFALNGSTGFVAKLNPTGTDLLYSTYLGGTLTDNIFSMALDSSGDVYVAGAASSSNFPVTSGVIQSTNKSAPDDGWNEFVTKLNPAGTALIYSTYLGGSDDYVFPTSIKLAIDSAGDAFVLGTAISTDFPVTAGAFQTTNKAKAGNSDLTLSKINPAATKLLYSTYLGGSGSNYGDDLPNGLVVDTAGNTYLTGVTWESNYPVTKGAFQTSSTAVANDLASGFVTKMNPAGTALVYSTYLGGSGADRAFAVAVDSSGDAFITGSAGSSDFPVTSNAYQSTNLAAFNNGSVVFLTELNPAGNALVYSTYFGGQNSFGDTGYGVALGAKGSVYFAGITGASDFPITKSAYEQTFNSQNFSTGFVSEFTFSTAPATAPTATLLTSTQNPSITGTPLTFTASVTPATGSVVPTGNVVFNIDQKNVATVALNSLGYASYSVSTLANGQHSILASYQGSTTYSASGGNIVESITASTPTITPPTGTYPAAQLVTIAESTPGTVVYYTTDGSAPATSATAVKYTGPFAVSETEKIQAIAKLSGAPNSIVASSNYSFLNAPTALAVPASSVSTPNATLNALVNTNGMSGSYHFIYGTSPTALTSTTPVTPLVQSPIGSRINFVPFEVSAKLTSLTTKTRYYYQVVVTTPAGTSSGIVLSFTTN